MVPAPGVDMRDAPPFRGRSSVAPTCAFWQPVVGEPRPADSTQVDGAVGADGGVAVARAGDGAGVAGHRAVRLSALVPSSRGDDSRHADVDWNTTHARQNETKGDSRITADSRIMSKIVK